MYLTQNISNFLETSSDSSIMTFFKFKQTVLETVKDKLRLVKAWRNTGSTEENLERIKTPLGKYWRAYIHFSIEKLLGMDMQDIIDREFDFEYKKGMEVIIQEILHKKMYQFLEINGITSLSSEKKIYLNTDEKRIIRYKVKSKYSDSYLWDLTLVWNELGGYEITSGFLNSGTNYSAELKEESLKSIKGIMYKMTEDRVPDLDRLDGVLDLISYTDPILNCFIENLKSYTKRGNN